LFDRELSWIAFNRRLLYEAAQRSQPILERLLKLTLAAAALDEYFMVRIPLLKGMHSREPVAVSPTSLRRLHSYLRALLARQQALFTFGLRPKLASHQLYLWNHQALTDIQKAQLHHRFNDEVMPVLSALTTSVDAPIPDFSNLSLNIAICLERGETRHLAWVKLPRVLPRLLLVGTKDDTQTRTAVPLEQVIAAHGTTLFPDYQLRGCYPFRVTRSADLGTLDSETANLMEMIQEGLQQRQQQGVAVRLETTRTMPAWVRSRLLAHLNLSPTDSYALRGWLGLAELQEVAHWPRPDLRLPAPQSVMPASLFPQTQPSTLSFMTVSHNPADHLLEELAQRDILVRFPYHSFTDTVERFVAQAATDPQVLAIKMTLYRTAIDAPIVRSLMAAAKTDKQIVVLVELTAPFDEAMNIHWAKSLEKAGAHVVYGVVGFRTHTNLVLVVRQESDRLQQYAYLGTGDYLPDRPQPYKDLGLLTSAPNICTDLTYLFNFLTGCSQPAAYETLLVSPGDLKEQLQGLIQRETEYAQQGHPARIIVKLNLLADPDIIESLYSASQAGVEIDLIVRGLCRLRPGVAGMSDRIRVTSVLGQYVEHSRIVYCQNGDRPQAWIGTADWTPSGLNERIEVMVPIQAEPLVHEIKALLDGLLTDNADRWVLHPNGSYIQPSPIRVR
jgi:polyphosphate kinase